MGFFLPSAKPDNPLLVIAFHPEALTSHLTEELPFPILDLMSADVVSNMPQ